MRRIILVSSLAAILVLGFGFELRAQAGVVSKEEVLFMEIPEVVTASKKAEPINKAPSVAYVITGDEIKRSGARSLADILKRVPGMRISMREGSLMGSRGFTSDQNDKFVFLVNGVPIINLMQDGAYGLLDIPDLAMVNRIEVIKGPGSTLWGSDAAFGVINILTKKGGAVGGLQVTLDHSTNNNFNSGNIMYGDKLVNGDYLFSLTYYKSDGFGAFDNPGGGNAIFNWNQPNGVDQPNQNVAVVGSEKATGYDSARLLNLPPGFELYGKVDLGDVTLKSRAAYTAQQYLWNTVYGLKYTDAVMKDFYTEVEKTSDLSDARSLTTKVYIDGLTYERGIPEGYDDPAAKADIETMTEMGFGAETTYNATVADRHHIVAGAKAMSTHLGPSLRDGYYVASGESTNSTEAYPYLVNVNPLTDDIYSLYLEDSFDVSSRLTLVGGAALDYNDLREVGSQLTPRAAIIYQLTDNLGVKYCYNTGYDRPPAQKKFGKQYGHVVNSEKINEHDLEFSYNTDKTSFTATGYTYNVSDYFTWYDNGLKPPAQVVGQFNRGTAKGSGLELDLHQILSNKLAGYANYSYSDSTVNGAKIVGEPQQVYNVGADADYAKDLTVNLNVNGWVNMYHGQDTSGQDLYWSGLGEQVVDLSIVRDNLLDRPISLTLYAQNLLNNKVHVGMTGWPGYTYLPGASYGLKLAWTF